LGTKTKELHTPTSTPKKKKRRQWGQEEELKLDRVLYKNKAWQKVDIVF